MGNHKKQGIKSLCDNRFGDLAPPLANRFRHRTYQLDPQSWVESFPSYWGNVPQLGFGKMQLDEDEWGKARAMVAGFLRSRPSKLLEIPKEETRRGSAWPSPRTWDFASRQLAAILSDGGQATEAMPYVADCIGEGVAVEFMAWCKEVNLPDPWMLLKNPDKFKLPDRGDVAFAVLSAVAAAAVTKLTEANWKAAWQILGLAAKAGAKDIAGGAARTLGVRYKSSLSRPPEIVAYFIPILKAAGLMTGVV